TWVNDAGVSLGGTVEATQIDEIERLIRVNLLGTIFGVKAALPYMKRQGGGTIINIGSVAGVRAFPIQTTYSATKHGIEGFPEGLRLELPRERGDFHVPYIAPTLYRSAPVPPVPDQVRPAARTPAVGLRPPDRGRVDRLRRRAPAPGHLRRRR